MEEPRTPREQQDPEVTAALPVVSLPEPSREAPEEPPEAEPVASSTIREEVPEALEEERVSTDTAFDRLDREVASGLTVSDGFRFGCGFVLALVIGTLAFLIVLTAFFAVGAMMGFKLPF